jgi:hypothetical protein
MQVWGCEVSRRSLCRLPRDTKLRKGARLGWVRSGTELLRPRAGAAAPGTGIAETGKSVTVGRARLRGVRNFVGMAALDHYTCLRDF